MRAMPPAGFRRRPRATAVAAALSLTVIPTVLVAAGTTPAAADSVGLPVVRSVLAEDDTCVEASEVKARSEPWTMGALGAARARPLSQGAGQTVAVVDTGVGESAPALAGRVTAIGDAGKDCVGHGTFAAGLIAATPGAAGGRPDWPPRPASWPYGARTSAAGPRSPRSPPASARRPTRAPPSSTSPPPWPPARRS